MADFETVKLVGGPLSEDVRVELPSGESIPGLLRIAIAPIEPDSLVTVTITLLARVELTGPARAE